MATTTYIGWVRWDRTPGLWDKVCEDACEFAALQFVKDFTDDHPDAEGVVLRQGEKPIVRKVKG
jgi:hypothetical protein